ncbi:hypothetical protein ACIRST_08950 [Kitasatospora sp. NPDC101447]|uniref:hypothetical protein n=1 Tax=Kitasatospora sp. NPDC101447 TaxID=3364102 RepID=UPI0037FC6EE9
MSAPRPTALTSAGRRTTEPSSGVRPPGFGGTGTVDAAVSSDGHFLYARTGVNGILDEFADRSLEGAEIHQAWISRRVATDVLPLLVNTCDAACLQILPEPPEDYVRTLHTGGPGLAQPLADHA